MVNWPAPSSMALSCSALERLGETEGRFGDVDLAFQHIDSGLRLLRFDDPFGGARRGHGVLGADDETGAGRGLRRDRLAQAGT